MSYSFDQMVEIANQVSAEKKMPALLLIACGIAEGNLVWNQTRPSDPSEYADFWVDVSGGAWQQAVRYDPAYLKEFGNTDNFPGIDAIERIFALQFDPYRSARLAADTLKSHLVEELRKQHVNIDLTSADDLTEFPMTDADLLGAMYRYNWPNGFGNVWSRATAEDYQRGLDGAKAVLAGQLGDVQTVTQPTDTPLENAVAFPDVPDSVVDQQNDWSCAVRSTYALLYELHQIGSGPEVTYGDGGPNDVYDWMVPALDDTKIGLHFGDGSQLESLLVAQGYTVVTRNTDVTLDQARDAAKSHLLLLGFHRWGPAGHWVMVRGVDSDNLLILENPAVSYLGISDRIGEGHWSTFAPCTMLVVDGPSVIAPPAPTPVPVPAPVPTPVPTPAPPVDVASTQIAALKAEIETLRTLTGCAYNADGNVRKALNAVINAKATGKGAKSRGDLIEELVAIDKWLDANRPK